MGLRYNENAIAVGAQTERRGLAGPVSFLLRGWDSPAAFIYTLLLFLDLEQFLRLPAEAAEFIVILGVLVHPPDRLFIPFAGLILGAKLPVGHGQEEPFSAIPALAHGHRLLQGYDRQLERSEERRVGKE